MKIKKYSKIKNQMKCLQLLVELNNKIYHYCKNMAEENISQELRLKNIDETRNYFLKK